MKHIVKGKEPASLLLHRKSTNANYDNIPGEAKDELRIALLKEQGFICCYCMQRIGENNMKVEHWKPQRYIDFQLDYHNLFAACNGNEGHSKSEQHCDTHKGEQEITINPSDARKNCEFFIRYRKNGKIYSDDKDIDNDLNRILNLNTQTLVNNRAVVLEQIIAEMMAVKGSKSEWFIQYVRRIIRKYETKVDSKYPVYCRVVVYFLEKRFSNKL